MSMHLIRGCGGIQLCTRNDQIAVRTAYLGATPENAMPNLFSFSSRLTINMFKCHIAKFTCLTSH